MLAHETGTRLGKESADTTIKEHHDPPPNLTENLAQSSRLHNHADCAICLDRGAVDVERAVPGGPPDGIQARIV